MPRLVRKEPLIDRLKAYLDPWDWLMWASEELNSNDWDDFAKSYASGLGLSMNILYMIARANAGPSKNKTDDVFGDYQRKGAGWFAWFMGIVVFSLTTLSFLNAFYTFYRKRHYRLFEQSIETNVSTPSAQRVRVDSSPSTSSPLRFLQNIIASSSAEARAHPDASRDVWEVAVWDPNPLCLHIFCLFSPLHVVLYYFNLPVAPLDPQPSIKVFTTVIIGAILSLQMLYLRSSFLQQAKDAAIIQREVLHEYDNKFVHPILQKPCRDVAIQTIPKRRTVDSGTGPTDLVSDVRVWTPTTVINRGFRTHPNQAYASQYDPDNLSAQPNPRPLASRANTNTQTPSLRPGLQNAYTSSSTATGADFSSPIRQSTTPGPNPFRNPPSAFRQPSQIGRGGDGGSLGVYSHAQSPLRKAASAGYLREVGAREVGAREVGAREERGRERESLGGVGERRSGSPLKRMSTPGGVGGSATPGTFERGLDRGFGGLGGGRRESGRF
ncbi:hypothetical protein BCR34DRAFT_673864 [Clohesyomyces aquaticus]|uniref:Nuclear rim protein 1 n=1 Tax=Clohesyomyces aquaticus TaxID=1231657 RepID=A0A1Y1ZM73_9PLEO|nr:hypothetical protein BCR34DRAFT_673864 [Clohesyomyces aquaticus]